MMGRYIKLGEIIVSFILAFTIALIFYSKEENFEDLALGDATKPFFAKSANCPIQTLGFRDSEKIIKGCEDRDAQNVVLILGNSQSHSINQIRQGDRTFPGLLFDSLSSKSVDVISSSIPNAGLEEFYLLYKAWIEKIKIKAIVLPVFLDDTREEGLKSVFFKELQNFRITDTNIVAQRINSQLTQQSELKNEDLEALNKTFQEKTELYLNEVLDKNFSPWHLRPTIRGSFFNRLYKLRNTVFGIDAQSKRKIIPEFYKNNMEALKTMLIDCKKHGISVLLYIPPIRNDVSIPYVTAEYNSFKSEIKELCLKYNCNYINIESIVPSKYWGYKGSRTLFGKSDIDFMHFQYPGHKLVAKTLQPEIEKLIK